MADSPNGIGSSRGGGGLFGLKQTLGLDPAQRPDRRDGDATTVSGATAGPVGRGPRGNRMPPLNLTAENVDRNAPRGTYLDIIV